MLWRKYVSNDFPLMKEFDIFLETVCRPLFKAIIYLKFFFMFDIMYIYFYIVFCFALEMLRDKSKDKSI